MKEMMFLIRLVRNSVERVARNAVRIATRAALYCGIEMLTVLAVGTGFAIGLSGCKTQQQVISGTATETAEQPDNQWHTCLIQGAKAILTYDGQTMTANCTMQTVRDSMLIISVMPMLGIEMFRLEATPTGLLAVDKMNKQYIQTDYQELNRYVTPAVTWEHLQQIATNELPDAFVGYTVGERRIALRIDYPQKQQDVPVRMTGMNLARYDRINIFEQE